MRRLSLGTAVGLLVVDVVALAAGAVIGNGVADTPHTSTINVIAPGEFSRWGSMMLAAAILSVLIARYRPDNKLSWAFALGALCGSLGPLADVWGIYALEAHPATVAGGTIAKLGAQALFYPAWALLAVHMPLRFPNGELLSKRWRWVSRIGTLGAVGCFIEIFHPRTFDDDHLFVALPRVTNPIGIPGFGPVAELGFGLGIFAIFAGTLAAVVSLFIRYRRADGEERQQLKWVATTTVLVVGFGMVAANLNNAVDSPVVEAMLAATGSLFLLIPVALGVAIFKYRLYGVDVIINKAVVYFALAAFVTAVYVLVAVGLGAAVGSRGEPNAALSLIATALVAIAFQPVRERVQRVANRLVYGERFTPYEVISGFGHRMAETMSLDVVLPQMAEAAGIGVGADAVRVRMFLPGGERDAVWPDAGRPEGWDVVLPVAHQGEQVGEIAVRKPVNDPLTDRDTKLLTDLASHAGLALRNLRLTGELERRLEELQASRQRLVTAQDDERRRMERDIHDGAQQQLVALSIQLGLVKRVIESDVGAASQMLDQLKQDARDALETLRDLARGLFPPTLVDRGLIPALESHIEKSGLRATIAVTGLNGERLPANIEAALYFIVREALQNASKHAPDSTSEIRFELSGRRLAMTITDHGPGFDPATVVRGSGLQNMVDRIEALGGTLVFESRPGQGTTIRAELPVEDRGSEPRGAELIGDAAGFLAR